MTLNVLINNYFLTGRTEVILSVKETGRVLKKFKYSNRQIKGWSEDTLISDAISKYNNLKSK